LVESVATGYGLLIDRLQVSVNRCAGIWEDAKPSELGMVGVATSATDQDSLGEKGLAPQRHEAGWIEVFRVKSPESHSDSQVWSQSDARKARTPGRCLTLAFSGEP
jgi:hypothetical protein